MSHFKNMLGSEESLFLDHVPLDYDYIPKLIPYREKEQRHVATCIKPLFSKRNGRNAFIFGEPGVGKTVACRHLLKELEEETDEIIPIYINCWQRNTSFKVICEICDAIGYKFTHNKKGDELFKIVKEILNKKSAVIVLDEVDKLEDIDIIYYILEEIYRKTLILITNYKDWISSLEERIKSRLMAELLEFKAYNQEETKGILKERMRYAFVEGVWQEDLFNIVAEKAYELSDMRAGLYLLKEAANAAEDDASKKIEKKHVDIATKKLDEFYIKNKEQLEDETKFILDVIKNNSGKKIGDLFRVYQEEGGKSVYKTFQRKIDKLAKNKFISIKKISGGPEGSTTIIEHAGSIKKLTEF